MALEIERKFLVCGDFRKEAFKSCHVVQGYLRDSHGPFRVRIMDGTAYLTRKGARDASGTTRVEVENEIPVSDAEFYLGLCKGRTIEKTRHLVRSSDGEHVWEIDEFHGPNEGLVVAEIELGSADEPFPRPEWLGEEVTRDPRYHNSALLSRPWTAWAAED